jgi:hypothetical protein
MAHGRPTRFYWHVLFAGHTLEIFPESLKVWVQKYPPLQIPHHHWTEHGLRQGGEGHDRPGAAAGISLRDRATVTRNR